jgi:hypothetical protein
MPVFIGTFAKIGKVLFIRPVIDPQLMGSIKFFNSCKVNDRHQVTFKKSGAKVQLKNQNNG